MVWGLVGTSRYPALRRTTREHPGTGGQPSCGCPFPTSPSRCPRSHPRTHTSTRPDRSERSWLRPQPRSRPERPRPERTSPGRTTRPPIRQGERPEPPRRRGERAAPAMRAFGVRGDSPVPRFPKQGKLRVSGSGGGKIPPGFIYWSWRSQDPGGEGPRREKRKEDEWLFQTERGLYYPGHEEAAVPSPHPEPCRGLCHPEVPLAAHLDAPRPGISPPQQLSQVVTEEGKEQLWDADTAHALLCRSQCHICPTAWRYLLRGPAAIGRCAPGLHGKHVRVLLHAVHMGDPRAVATRSPNWQM